VYDAGMAAAAPSVWINQRQFDVFDELVASDFVLHSALLGEV
jgi:hypothetical protein